MFLRSDINRLKYPPLGDTSIVTAADNTQPPRDTLPPKNAKDKGGLPVPSPRQLTRAIQERRESDAKTESPAGHLQLPLVIAQFPTHLKIEIVAASAVRMHMVWSSRKGPTDRACLVALPASLVADTILGR